MAPMDMHQVQERLNDLDQARHQDNIQAKDKFDAIDQRLDETEERAKDHSRRLNSEELARSTIIAHLKTKVDAMVWAWVCNTCILAVMALVLIFGG